MPCEEGRYRDEQIEILVTKFTNCQDERDIAQENLQKLNNELQQSQALIRTLREEYDMFQLRVQNERRDQAAIDEAKLRTTQFAHEEQIRHALARTATLEQMVADLRRLPQQPERHYESKPRSTTSRNTQEYYLYGNGDDYDGGDDDDDDHFDYEWTEPEYAHHRPKHLPKVFAGTQTQTRTATASTSTGAREPPRDDGGRPPRRPGSGGGSDGGGGGRADATPPGRRQGFPPRGGDGRGYQGGGGPGGGPGDGDDGGDDDVDQHLPTQRPVRNTSGVWTREKREADEVKLSGLPKAQRRSSPGSTRFQTR